MTYLPSCVPFFHGFSVRCIESDTTLVVGGTGVILQVQHLIILRYNQNNFQLNHACKQVPGSSLFLKRREERPRRATE